jgi:hypothetical protein
MFGKQVLNSQRLCWICGKSVALEDCRVDEHGLPVHEECYVVKIATSRDTSQINKLLRPGTA